MLMLREGDRVFRKDDGRIGYVSKVYPTGTIVVLTAGGQGRTTWNVEKILLCNIRVWL